ncbi:unnamed protein product [Dovyalis caffra]|uniref:Uncharacterized protein n=1 Tax=Dovyalis caffra TaxID=77055 RepID=A0AAV1SCD9_9ROSI|nr:unnamed protein product [Dovyalis caffra]
MKPDDSDLKRVCVVGSERSSVVDRERINNLCFSWDGEWLVHRDGRAGVVAKSVSTLRRSAWGEVRWKWMCENGTPSWHSVIQGQS